MPLKNFLLDCLFPKKCYGCGASETWLCPKCFLILKKYQGEVPRALEDAGDLIMAGQYQDPILRSLITAFKFASNRELSVPLFAFLKSALDNKIIISGLSRNHWQNIFIIPVPLHKSRQKWRGYNQSELIAREISNYYGWPLSLDLKKIKKTKIQAELNEEARLNNQTGAFIWTGGNLAEHDVILVDDIITSGATISEAAKTLTQAGAKRVIKVAVAKG